MFFIKAANVSWNNLLTKCGPTVNVDREATMTPQATSSEVRLLHQHLYLPVIQVENNRVERVSDRTGEDHCLIVDKTSFGKFSNQVYASKLIDSFEAELCKISHAIKTEMINKNTNILLSYFYLFLFGKKQ